MFVSPSQHFIVFKSGNISLQTDNDINSVQFPDYQKRLDIPLSQSVDIPCKDLKLMVTQAELMSGKDYRAGAFEIGKGITCTLKNPQRGSYNKAVVNTIGECKPPFSIVVDLRYMREALSEMPDGVATIMVDPTEKFIRLEMGAYTSMVLMMF